MEKRFNLKIITPEKIFFDGDIVSLDCETTEGRYGVLPDHCAAIAGLVAAVTVFRDVDNKTFRVNTDSGILKIRNNQVTILCNSASWTE